VARRAAGSVVLQIGRNLSRAFDHQALPRQQCAQSRLARRQHDPVVAGEQLKIADFGDAATTVRHVNDVPASAVVRVGHEMAMEGLEVRFDGVEQG
jgi:hypothetical protein